MSVKIDTCLVDDLALARDPKAEVPADETVLFSVGAYQYEIDLTKKNAEKFHEKLAPYVRAGRKLTTGRSRPASTRRRSRDIRQWAKDHGIAVSERGRIPAGVVERFEAAGGRVT